MNKSANEIYDYLDSHWPDFQERFGETCTSEAELARTLGSERFATRRALQRLVSEGKLFHIRHQGYRFKHHSFDVRLDSSTSYTRFCKERNLEPHAEILSIAQEKPREDIAARLKTKEGDLVWHLVFHRFTGTIPFCLTDSWLPLERTRGLAGFLRDSSSLYGILKQQYGILASRAESRITALPADKEEAKLLDTALAWPLIRVDSLALCQNHLPIEYCETRYRSDMVSFSVDLRSTGSTGLKTKLEGSEYDPTITH